jgi:hypothetical protein
MDIYGVVIAVAIAAGLIAVALLSARAKRASALRDAETRRPDDKGKHVEL